MFSSIYGFSNSNIEFSKGVFRVVLWETKDVAGREKIKMSSYDDWWMVLRGFLFSFLHYGGDSAKSPLFSVVSIDDNVACSECLVTFWIYPSVSYAYWICHSSEISAPLVVLWIYESWPCKFYRLKLRAWISVRLAYSNWGFTDRGPRRTEFEYLWGFWLDD